MSPARVLLVEPYLGGSHRAWAEGWRAASRHDIEILGLDGRHWRWRMRGSAVTLAPMAEALDGDIDVVVASNMLDLAGFLGLTRRRLGTVPVVQYLHENQLSYPRRPGEALDAGLAWMQWRGLVAADELWCNSGFHRGALLAELDRLLDAVPDHDHRAWRRAVGERFVIAHPGVVIDDFRVDARPAGRRPLIVSNQRWHHDKDVGAVVRAVTRLIDRGVDVDLAVVGDPEGGEAERIRPLLEPLGDRVVADGLLPRDHYVDLLRRADVVVSAARGENFGIAVVEAIAAGAWPVLPDALSYPEVVPAEHHADCLYPAGGLGHLLDRVVARVAAGATAPPGLGRAMDRFDWGVVARQLDDRIDALRAGESPVA